MTDEIREFCLKLLDVQYGKPLGTTKYYSSKSFCRRMIVFAIWALPRVFAAGATVGAMMWLGCLWAGVR